jgi:(4-O-methyl)-D-glucuronate---lignin esterase
MVIASCSGEMGAALSRRDYGETVTSMAKNYGYQFSRNFLDYSNAVDRLPVDSHMLLSLIAPRPVFLNTGTEDRWSDPRGEFQAAIAASPVYHLLGKTGVVTNFAYGVTNLPANVLTNGSGAVMRSEALENYEMPQPDVPIMNDIGFQVHTGKHEILPEDWDRFLDFADLHFYDKPPHQYQTQQ